MVTVNSDLSSLLSWAPVKAADNSRRDVVALVERHGTLGHLAITKETLISPVGLVLVYDTELYAFYRRITKDVSLSFAPQDALGLPLLYHLRKDM